MSDLQGRVLPREQYAKSQWAQWFEKTDRGNRKRENRGWVLNCEQNDKMSSVF
jgi:hypothetical protein